MVNVAHTEAVGKTDALHYIITTIGTPAILVAKTPLNVNVSIQWEKMLSGKLKGAISFHPNKTMYVYALILNRVRTKCIHNVFMGISGCSVLNCAKCIL